MLPRHPRNTDPLTGLVELGVHGCYGATDEAPAPLTQLVELDAFRCEGLTDAAFVPLRALGVLEH